jgi:hypothetical protein
MFQGRCCLLVTCPVSVRIAAAMTIPRLLTALAFTSLATAQEAAAPAVQKLDFQSLDAGPVPDELMPTDQEAKFSIVAEGDNKLLEMAGQPIVDGGVLLGKSVKGGCTVTAKIRATGKRRTQPRFGVGLHGVSGPRLMIVPAAKSVEIFRNVEKEESVASVPFAWTSGEWMRLELTLMPSADGKSAVIEGRVWADGQPRPEKPSVTYASQDAPGQGKASVWATPYAELPVQFDDVEVKPATAEK